MLLAVFNENIRLIDLGRPDGRLVGRSAGSAVGRADIVVNNSMLKFFVFFSHSFNNYIPMFMKL